MPSPFPGMDPYLEQRWLDVHTALIAGCRNRLNERLPTDLAAAAEERILVEAEDGPDHAYGPDVQVLEGRGPRVEGGGVAVAVQAETAVDAPIRLVVDMEPATERFVRIVEAAGGRLITIIEFVSPSNKTGHGLRMFRAKRKELLAANVNFVEIDLVREGDWVGLLRPHAWPGLKFTQYRAAVRRPDEPEAVYYYPMPIRAPLPEIVIPLREKDPEVRLPLQPLVDDAYLNGRYERRIDYTRPCVPPLEGEDDQWADELLKKADRR